MLYGYLIENKALLQESILDRFKRKKKKYQELPSTPKVKVTDPEKRKEELSLVQSIVKSVLSKYNNPKGIELYDNEEEDINNFLDGTDKYIHILSWDAWEGTDNRARSEEYYRPFEEILEKIWKEIDNQIKNNSNLHGMTEIDADWDDGYMNYILYH